MKGFQAFKNQGLEFVLDPVRGLLDLLMAQGLGKDAAGHVGNAGDGDWLKSIGVPPMGEEAVKNLREQGNKSHVSPNMMSLYLKINGKVSRPYSRIIIRRKK